jgi:DNA-binding transcriptional MocR family regulator
MSDEDKERLVRLLERNDLPLIEDDAYGELVFDGRPRPAKAFDRDGRVLLCGSVSKTLAPGYRVGWAAPGRYQEEVERLKFASTLASPTLPQMAVAEFLASGGYDKHLRRLRRVLSGRVERFREAIAERFPDGTRVSAPMGGFVLWAELPAGVDALVLQERALDRGIAVAPGPIFSARGRFGNFVRLSCGSWSPRIEAGLAVVGELACQLAGRPAGARGGRP